MTEHPKVFISYSHDSPEHKQWVSELAAQLRNNGIDVILDQWDLGYGDDFPQFMQRGIVEANRVLVVCTDEYVTKANKGVGGTGYECMIVNAELVKNLGTDKFIPIIRQSSGNDITPIFLGTKVYADFRIDKEFDEECVKLCREIHNMPIVDKPPLGKNPFPTIKLDPQLTDIPEEVLSVQEAYSTATKLIRAGDTFGWRELIKKMRPKVFKDLVQWREKELDGQKPESKEQLVQTVDKAVEIISPLMVVALAGVESGREEFRDQKAFLDDLQNIVGWKSAGYDAWIQLPKALGYVYHSMHGGVCLSTNQIDLALGLAQIKIPVAGGTKFFPLWEMSEFRGYAYSISGTRGGNCLESWSYLTNAYDRWGWLSSFYEDKLAYQSSLVAYYMALNIHELASVISLGREDMLQSTSEPYFQIPLTFLTEDYNTTKKAISLLRNDPNTLSVLWESLRVEHKKIESLWENWIDLSERALIRSMSFNETTLINLADLYRYLFKGM